jgi:hypothetical protein
LKIAFTFWIPLVLSNAVYIILDDIIYLLTATG